VAGLVNRKDGSVERLRRIHFVPFSIDICARKSGSWNEMTKEKMFGFLDSLHKTHSDIPCVYRNLIRVSDCTKEKLSGVLSERRSTAPYEIDGIVVWDNSGKHAPNTSGNPEHAFAFKMVLDDQTAETLVTGIEWNVSRTGVWKPVVLIDPVVIGGTTIGRTTGHNARWLVDRGIGVGARILLIRSGDVIPKIQRVISGVSKEHITMPPSGTWKWDDK
jgi:NAD-dependent DNA ligase